MTKDHPTLEDILLDLIDPGFNFRSDLKRSAEFNESVRVEGVRVPPSLTRLPNGRFRTIGGHGRLQAAREAGFKTVICLVHGEMPKAEEQSLGLLDNLAREDITHYDTFKGIVALDELGMKGNVIAPKLGLSAGMVSQYLSLRNLTPEEMEAFKSGLPVTKAFKIAAEKDPVIRLGMLDMALNGTREDMKRKARRTSAAPAVRASKIKVPLVSGATVTVAGEGVSMDEALEAVQEAAKQIKAAIAKGITAKSAMGYWKDIAAAG